MVFFFLTLSLTDFVSLKENKQTHCVHDSLKQPQVPHYITEVVRHQAGHSYYCYTRDTPTGLIRSSTLYAVFLLYELVSSE